MRGLIRHVKVTGASLFPFFFVPWLLEYATLHCAIIVSADYRFLPESSADDILQDLAGFWSWFHKDLESYLNKESPACKADLDRILVVGDSAGGYLATQSNLQQPAGIIKAMILMYPMIDLKSDFYEKKYDKPILGHGPVSNAVVDEHMKSVQPGSIVSSANPPARLELAIAIVQNGRFLEFFGREPHLFPLERLSQAKSMPPTFIFHGSEDSAVPVEGSKKFVEALSKIHPETEVILKTPPGDHGVDVAVTVETEWMKEGLALITQRWLG